MAGYTRLTLKGHKLIRSTSGVGDSYQQGRCECGKWQFTGWTERYEAVTGPHNDHVEEEREKVLPGWIVESYIGNMRMTSPTSNDEWVIHAGNAKSAALIAWQDQTSQYHQAIDLNEQPAQPDGSIEFKTGRASGWRFILRRKQA